MIRFHNYYPHVEKIAPHSHVTTFAGPEKYLVSARRKPRGFVIKAKEAVAIFKSPSRYEASLTWEVVTGWKPVGFNGEIGKVYCTRREAALELISNHKFDVKENKP